MELPTSNKDETEDITPCSNSINNVAELCTASTEPHGMLSPPLMFVSNSVRNPFVTLGEHETIHRASHNRKGYSKPDANITHPKSHWSSTPAPVRWSNCHFFNGMQLSRSFILTLSLIAIANVQFSYAKIRSMDPGDPVGNIRHVLPELELGNNSVTNVRFNIGSTAFLPCRFPSFPRPHENRVSWVRRWDWHILTAGRTTYSYDDRFVVLHKDGTNDWTLQIKFLKNDDNGTYECQVHSGSGFMSQFVNLLVVTPKAVILEPRELTVTNGDNFVLTCVIQQSLEPPVYVMWLHGGVPLNYAPDRPRLNVELEVKGSRSRSLLKIKDAKFTDSGNYTCTAPNAINAWVLVYVTEDMPRDTVAAVQRRHPDSSGTVVSSSSSAGSSPSGSVPSSSSSSAAVPPSSEEVSSSAPASVGQQQWLPSAVLLTVVIQVVLLTLFGADPTQLKDTPINLVKGQSDINKSIESSFKDSDDDNISINNILDYITHRENSSYNSNEFIPIVR